MKIKDVLYRFETELRNYVPEGDSRFALPLRRKIRERKERSKRTAKDAKITLR